MEVTGVRGGWEDEVSGDSKTLTSIFCGQKTVHQEAVGNQPLNVGEFMARQTA